MRDKMTQKEAVSEYERLTYDLSKHMSCINDIYSRCHHINEEMGWDGMFEIDFEDALRKLGNVLAACVCYTLEDKYEKNKSSSRSDLEDDSGKDA